MPHRRDFLKGSIATAAIVATASSVVVDTQQFTAIGKNTKRLPVILDTEAHKSFEAFLSSRQDPIHTDFLKVGSRYISGTNGWTADNIQMHTSYLPSIDGAPLASSITHKNKHLNWMRHHGYNALHVNTVPCGVIINHSKAAHHNIESFSLSGFNARGVKPQFSLNSSASSPENSWILTSLSHAGVLEAGQNNFIKKRKSLKAFIENYSTKLSTPCFHDNTCRQLYFDLMDEDMNTVAVYGSPEKLQSFLNEGLNKSRMSDNYTVISLQDFLGIETHSFFANRFLQLGSEVNHPLADDIVNLTTDYFMSDLYINNKYAWLGDLKIGQKLNKVVKYLEEKNNNAYFKNLNSLGYLTDGGFLVKFMLDVASGIEFHGENTSGKLIEISDYATIQAQNRWDEAHNDTMSVFI